MHQAAAVALPSGVLVKALKPPLALPEPPPLKTCPHPPKDWLTFVVVELPSEIPI